MLSSDAPVAVGAGPTEDVRIGEDDCLFIHFGVKISKDVVDGEQIPLAGTQVVRVESVP